MKIWTYLVTISVLSTTAIAQYSDSISVQAVDDYDDFDVGFSEVLEGPPPCNGFPEYRNIPVNQAFYVGAHNAGSDLLEHGHQKRDILRMLEDGIRFLDVQLCKDQESLVVCSDTTLSTNTFQNVLEKAFTFARNEVEQFFIVHVKSNNVNTREIETILDQVCEVHTNQTQGTDEFVKGKCPFVYTYRPEKGPWKSMGEIVNYDPEMAQWEGDGELVGVRTKFMLTVSDDVIQPSDYASSYVTPVFWRSLDNTIDSLDGFKQGLAQLCRVPGYGIGLGSFGALNNKIYHPDYLEDALLNRDGCNLNDSPLNTFFTHILVDHYEDQLPYLKELERRMMDLNYAKWTGNYRMMTPSLFRKKKVERDEL